MSTDLQASNLLLKLQILKFAIACGSYYNVRDDLGRFAEKGGSSEKVEETLNKMANEDPIKLGIIIEDYISNIKTFNATKKEVYKALKILNPAIIDSTIMTGMVLPNNVQEAMYGTIKKSSEAASSEAAKTMKKLRSGEIDLEKLKKYAEESWDNPVTRGARQIVANYERYKKDMDKLKKLENYGETEWAGQVGRMDALGIEVSQKALPIVGFAVCPEIMAGESTLEAMIPVIEQAIGKGLMTNVALKAPSALNDEIGKVVGEKPSNIAIGLTAGAIVGGAMDDVGKAMDESRNAPKKLPEMYAEVKNSAEIANSFIQEFDKAIDDAGIRKTLQAKDVTAEDFIKGMRKVYNTLPDEQKKVFEDLTGDFGKTLKNKSADKAINKL